MVLGDSLRRRFRSHREAARRVQQEASRGVPGRERLDGDRERLDGHDGMTDVEAWVAVFVHKPATCAAAVAAAP